MAEFKNERLGVSFELPDKFTVRDHLRFKDAAMMSGADDTFSRAWAGIVPMISGWECKTIPDPKTFNIDEGGNASRAADIIAWVVNVALGHMDDKPDPN